MLHVLLKIRGMHAAGERAGVAAGTVSNWDWYAALQPAV